MKAFDQWNRTTALSAVLLAGFGIAACGGGVEGGKVGQSSLGTGLQGVDDDFSGFPDKQATTLKELLVAWANTPGFPQPPRRTASITEIFANDSGFKVGLSGTVLGVGGGGTTTVAFGTTLRSTLLLVRTMTNDNDSFITTTPDGKEALNVQPGVGFVGVCSYAASVRVASRFLGEISVLGSGVSDQTELQKNIEVEQTSYFFSIKTGDTVPALQELCWRGYRDKVRSSVLADLVGMVKASITYDGPKDSDEKRILTAALYGPEASGLMLYDYEWNIMPAKITAGTNQVTLDGELQQPLPWYLAKWPQDVTYSYQIKDGQRRDRTVSVPSDQGWQEAANKLTDLIADEAYLEYTAVEAK